MYFDFMCIIFQFFSDKPVNNSFVACLHLTLNYNSSLFVLQSKCNSGHQGHGPEVVQER